MYIVHCITFRTTRSCGLQRAFDVLLAYCTSALDLLQNGCTGHRTTNPQKAKQVEYELDHKTYSAVCCMQVQNSEICANDLFRSEYPREPLSCQTDKDVVVTRRQTH